MACPTCPEATTLQCGIEPAEQICTTPVCNPNYATLPKKKAGRIILRSGECLYDNPTVPTVAPQVWQRGLDGIDRVAPLTSSMVPGKADAPCYTTIEEPAADTFGKMLIAQEDEDTGKTCIKQVPLEDTPDAYLAGYVTEDLCEGVPEVRPVRIIPTDIEGCPDGIKILGIMETEEEVQPGLFRTRPRIVQLNSPVGKTDQVPSYTAIDDVGEGCLQPAVWNNDGECVTLARLKTELGVMGAWAMCGGCLQFYELPKDGDGDYLENYVLAYNAGDDCWEWQLNGYADGEENLFTINTGAGVSSAGVKIVYALTAPPEGAQFAIVALSLVAGSPSGAANSVLIEVTGYYGTGQDKPVLIGRAYSNSNSNSDYKSDVIDLPIVSGTVAIKVVITAAGAATSVASATADIVGYR